MIEMILGTYGVLCWFLFKKKIVPANAYTICTAFLGGFVLAGGILMLLAMYHPASKDARLYAFTTPIVSQVRGIVVESISEGKDVKKGDVLFQIDPQPYQHEVDRLKAGLAKAQAQADTLIEQLKEAEAGTSQAVSQLRTAESEFSRQTQEDVQRAKAAVDSSKSRYDLAKVEFDRQSELLKSKVISQSEYDASKATFSVADAALKESQVALRQAEEKVKSGDDRVASARQALKIAESQEKSARIAAEADIGGVSPLVAQLTAELQDKVWDLEQTTVRAPADGFVTQVGLRPGQMAVPMPLSPVMVFVHGEKMILAASLPQNVITHIKPGLEVELAFKAKPGKIFKGKVNKVLPVAAEGQLSASGLLRSVTAASSPGRIPVVFDYDKDVEDLHLPGGAQATVAVYTEHLHALSFLRKILLRIKSWENYIFMP